MKPILPPQALNQHIAILGKTGSGKTYAAKGIVEHLLEQHRQVCVLDPTGAWWGLRLGADGKSKGFDIVLLGGKHGDIPLSPRSGAAVARLVTQQHASVVLDTSGMTVGEYTQWFIDFAGTLYTTIVEPMHLVIDEAHYFMPQGKAPDPQAGKMIHAGNRLMSGGRSKGIRGMMITQRPAKLHKDSLTCADTLIPMRVIAPQDRSAIKDWIDGCGDAKQGKTVLDSLAQLGRGEGWVWYPEGGHLERVKFPAITTYDSSATPKHGAKEAPQVGEIKLDELLAAMAEAVKEAEANDPKLLRAKIAELERKALGTGHQASVAESGYTVEKVQRMVSAVRASTHREVSKTVKELVARLEGLCSHAREIAGRLEAEADAMAEKAKEVAVAAAGSIKYTNLPAQTLRPSVPPRSSDSPGIGLPKADRAILTALAQQGVPCSKVKVAVLTGYSASGGGFNNALGRLRNFQPAPLITQGDPFDITPAGMDALGPYDPLPTGADLIAHWERELPKADGLILRALADAGGPITKEEIARLTGYEATGGGFNNALGRLRTLGLIEGKGELRLSEVFS